MNAATRFPHALVTGGAGFVGSQLVNRLLSLADRITVVDDCSTGNRANVPASDRIRFIESTYVDEALLDRLLPDVTHIFHLACKNLVLSADDMDQDFHVNLFGGYMLLKKANERASRLERFVYTSTASVYGNAPMLPTPETWYSTALPYSASKFGAEHYCQVFHRMYEMPVTVLRLSNVYGPGQVTSNPYCGVVAKFFEAAAAGLPLPIHGDGAQTRDFTYIDDAIDAVIAAATRPEAVGRVFNVGTGVETSVQELARLVAAVVDWPEPSYRYIPKRAVDVVHRRCLDAGALREALGWAPRHSLAEGLERTNQWIEARWER